MRIELFWELRERSRHLPESPPKDADEILLANLHNLSLGHKRGTRIISINDKLTIYGQLKFEMQA